MEHDFLGVTVQDQPRESLAADDIRTLAFDLSLLRLAKLAVRQEESRNNFSLDDFRQEGAGYIAKLPGSPWKALETPGPVYAAAA
jgi:hypothetical protein